MKGPCCFVVDRSPDLGLTQHPCMMQSMQHALRGGVMDHAGCQEALAQNRSIMFCALTILAKWPVQLTQAHRTAVSSRAVIAPHHPFSCVVYLGGGRKFWPGGPEHMKTKKSFYWPEFALTLDAILYWGMALLLIGTLLFVGVGVLLAGHPSLTGP